MKNYASSFALMLVACSAVWAGSVCPAGSGGNPFTHNPDNANTGCNVLITINADRTTTITLQDATPYENSEDVLIGIKNNSSTPVPSVSLSGPSIFGFDGDGICTFTFVGSSYCTAGQIAGNDPADYQGPTSTFSNITNGGNNGTVNFSPALAAGGSTYFSLEGLPTTSLTVVVGTGSGSGTPTTVPTLSVWRCCCWPLC